MATTITAGNATNGAAISSDNTGILELKTGSGAGTTALTLGTTGNVNFPILGQRITGDFSNGTLANRVMFQTSTVNGNTIIHAIPNGTGTVSAYALEEPAALTTGNSSSASFNLVSSTDVRFTSGIRGTGTYLPMTFYTGGSERLRVDTSGNLLVGTTSASAPSTTGFISTANTFGFKNRIINGAMVIDQRNAGASVTPNNSYTLDRWAGVNTQTSKFTVQQSSIAPAGFKNSLLVTSSSAYSVLTGDTFLIKQPIEGLNVADFDWGLSTATAITISFWVRSSLTGTFGGAVANSAANRSYVFTYAISSANTWEQKSITIPGDTTGTWLTTNGVGIELRFGLGSGATFSGTAGSWAAGNFVQPTGATSVVGTNGATFYITGVQLEKGSTATSFDYRPYGTELQLCQRYYETTYPPGTVVGSAVNGPILFRAPTTASAIYSAYSYKVTKRAAPAITLWNGVTGTSGTWRGSASANRTATAAGITESGFSVLCGASDDLIQYGQWEASAEL